MAQAALSERSRQRWLWFAPPVPAASNVRLGDLIESGPDLRWHDRDETAKLLAMMSPVNRAKIDLVMTNQGRAVGAIYKRTRVENGKKVQRAEVRFDVAGCLRTPGGGSSRQIIMTVEDGEVRSRLISARETARLMGLPEDYELPARYNDAYHLTGDGVAVPVVRHIARSILEPVLRPLKARFAAA
jgi:DNA (cytosine-5)-methyltransferase 1